MDSEESSESEESEDENEEEEEEEVILDDMDTDEWARVVTDLVDDMRHLQNNHILPKLRTQTNNSSGNILKRY